MFLTFPDAIWYFSPVIYHYSLYIRKLPGV